MSWFNNWLKEFLFTFQDLLKDKASFYPIFITLAVPVSLIFIIANVWKNVIFNPLPYDKDNTLFLVSTQFYDQNDKFKGEAHNYPLTKEFYSNQNDFEEIALAFYDRNRLKTEQRTHLVNGTFISKELLNLFEAKTILGRTFDSTESLDSFSLNAVISYDLWDKSFELDKNIIGKKLNYADKVYVVIGVLEKDFNEPQIHIKGRQSDIWLPWDNNSLSDEARVNWGGITSEIYVIGKKLPTISKSIIDKRLTDYLNDIWQQNVNGIQFFNGWKLGIVSEPLKNKLVGDVRKTIKLALLASFGIFIISLSNLTNLLFSRSIKRVRECAIRSSIGATRLDLFKEFFKESVIISICSVILATIIAQLSLLFIRDSLLTELPRASELHLNEFDLLLSIFWIGLLSVSITKISLMVFDIKKMGTILKSGGKSSAIQISPLIRKALVFSQILFSTILIVVALNLLTYSFNLINVKNGFDIEDVSSIEINISEQKYENSNDANSDLALLQNAMKSQLEIKEISVSNSPLSSFRTWILKTVDGNRFTPGAKRVDHKYFDFVKQKLKLGRYFEKSDIVNQNSVIIINEHFANELGGKNSAIGKILKSNQRTFEIIGVVENVKIPYQTGMQERVYIPSSPNDSYFLVKTKRGKLLSEISINKILNEKFDESFSLYELTRLEEVKSDMLFLMILVVWVSVIFTIFICLIAFVGIFGLLNYGTKAMQFDFGLHQALGASRKDVILLILSDHLKVVTLSLLLALSVIYLLATFEIGGALEVDYFGLSSFLSTFILVISITLLSFSFSLLKFFKNSIATNLLGN